jgi:hypothetical protein
MVLTRESSTRVEVFKAELSFVATGQLSAIRCSQALDPSDQLPLAPRLHTATRSKTRICPHLQYSAAVMRS